MPMMPHIDLTGYPDWFRYVYVGCLLIYAGFMFAGSIALYRKSK